MNVPQNEVYNNQEAKSWSRDYIYFCLILNSHSSETKHNFVTKIKHSYPCNQHISISKVHLYCFAVNLKLFLHLFIVCACVCTCIEVIEQYAWINHCFAVNLKLLIQLCVYVCTHVCTYIEVKGQLAWINHFSVPCWFWGSNSDCQAYAASPF